MLKKFIISVAYSDSSTDLPRLLFHKRLMTAEEICALDSTPSEFLQAAVEAAQKTEGAFYSLLVDFPALSSIAPRCFYASEREILLENPTDSETCSAVSKWSMEDAHAPNIDPTIAFATITTLAKFHSLTSELPSSLALPSYSTFVSKRLERIQASSPSSILETLTSAFTHYLSDPKPATEICSTALTIGLSSLFHSLNISSPSSLVHGDPNPGNTLFESSKGLSLLIDFQETSIGFSVIDIARFLLSSFTPESREEHMQSLLDAYFEEMAKHEVALNHSLFMRSLYLMILLDAVLILTAVGFTLESKSPPLLYELGERSARAIDFFSKEIEEALRLLK